jgi:hypothetical protein
VVLRDVKNKDFAETGHGWERALSDQRFPGASRRL